MKKYFRLYSFNYERKDIMRSRWNWPKKHCEPQKVESLHEMIQRKPEHFKYRMVFFPPEIDED